MAVCVVCLLCADHIHCAVHYESHEIQADLLRNDDPSIEQKEHLPMLTAITQLESPRTRRKRHQSHSIPSTQEAVNISKNSKQYLTKMFERFGSQESQTLDLQGFENMLEHLGLTHLLVANTNNQPTQNVSIVLVTIFGISSFYCRLVAVFIVQRSYSSSVIESSPRSTCTKSIKKRPSAP